MHYMIHAAPQRMWYVDDFLVPSMTAQGIPLDDITVWNDTAGAGNLFACIDSFASVAPRPGGVWHLQDDVIIARDFAERTKDPPEPITCGFGCNNFGPSMDQRGRVPMPFMWYSFQCQYLDNEITGEFVKWFREDAQHRTQYSPQLADRRHDDWFFREWMMEKHPHMWVYNMTPNLVDHIDFMLGGTLINRQRRIQVNRSAFWRDDDLVDELKEKLNNR